MNYIFDIDGTLADCSHRLHFIQQEIKDWDAFHKACIDDKPITTNIKFFQNIKWFVEDANIFILTGRPESSYKDTRLWFELNVSPICSAQTLMRKDGDHREDWVIKLEHLNRLNINKEETIIFDDRDQVVQNLRANGWTVFQVKNGEY